MNRRVAFPALLAMFLLLPSFAAAQQGRLPGTTEPRARTYSVRGNLRFAQNEMPAEMVKIDGRVIGKGSPGPVTKKLQQGFRALTKTEGVRY